MFGIGDAADHATARGIEEVSFEDDGHESLGEQCQGRRHVTDGRVRAALDTASR